MVVLYVSKVINVNEYTSSEKKSRLYFMYIHFGIKIILTVRGFVFKVIKYMTN